jgi:hypothetical protein
VVVENTNKPVEVAVAGDQPNQQQTVVKVSGAASSSSSSGSESCTPNDNQNIHNGICLTMRQLTQQCVDKKASASQNCSFGRFCCYSDDVIPPAVVPASQDNAATPAVAPVDQSLNKNVPAIFNQADNNKLAQQVSSASSDASQAKTCSPNSNPKINNGQCMTIRELRAKCVDNKASPSSQCDMGSWCCFNDDGVQSAAPAEDQNKVVVEVVTTAAPIVTEAAVTQAPVTEAPATPAPLASEDQSCTPNSKPDISNGLCMPTRDLRVRCKNQRVSKSPNCKLGHWCCFSDPSNPVQLSVSQLSRNINTL